MERPAFDRLITATLPKIEQAAKKYARLHKRFYEWEDLMQTALLRMLRFAELYDPCKGDLLPWACVIIINTIRTHIAQSMTMPDTEDINTCIFDHTPGPADSNPEEYAQMAFLVPCLNKETKLFVKGYNYPEIAALCGFRSSVTAKNRIDNCAGHLRKILGTKLEQGRRTRMIAKVNRIINTFPMNIQSSG